MEARLVEEVVGYPSACVLTDSIEGPFVETDRGCRYQGARFVVAVDAVHTLAVAAGLALSPERVREIEALEEEVEQLREWKAAAERDLEEYRELRGATATILRQGAVVDAKKRIVPRAWPGAKGVGELDRPLHVEHLQAARDGLVLQEQER